MLIVLSGAPSALADNVQLSVNGTGLGAAVELTPTGRMIRCTETRCFYEFPRGTTVNVTARPEAPSSFVRWLGACSHASTSCVVALDRSTSLTAQFTPVALYIAIPSRVVGSVYADLAASSRCGPGCWAYPYATQVRVKADAAPGHAFAGWSGGPPCGPVEENVCSVRLFQNTDVVPGFICMGSDDGCFPQDVQSIERTIETTVRVVGGRGRGSVLVSGKRCPPDCTLPIKRGTVVTLRADTGGLRFRGWSGSCAGASRRCQLAAFRDARGALPQITAMFSR